MTRRELLLEMDEIMGLPAGTIRGHEKLDELENWDSTALVSFLVLVESISGVNVSLGQIANCSTVADLVRLSHVDDAKSA
jgi:acyl carrier protein